MTQTDGLRERVESALEPLRTGLNADGADLQVSAERVADEVVVSLVVTPDTCEECIVAPNLMETMVKSAVSQAVPELTNVRFYDPRNAT